MNINKEMPCITNWVIKYDEIFQMPQFIQGKVLGDYSYLKNGQRIVIANIESMDVGKRTIGTVDKKLFKLVGPGHRMILLNESEMLKLEEINNPPEAPEIEWND